MRALLLTLAVGVTACAGDPADRPATWAYLHAAIIVPNCATSSCHSEKAQTAGIRLDDADLAYQQLIDRAFVIPGDPTSALMALLEGDERPRMPPDAPLPAADTALVQAWIEAGAAR